MVLQRCQVYHIFVEYCHGGAEVPLDVSLGQGCLSARLACLVFLKVKLIRAI